MCIPRHTWVLTFLVTVATCWSSAPALAQHVVWPLDVQLDSTSDRVALRWRGLNTLQGARTVSADGPVRLHMRGLTLHKPVFDRTPVHWRGRVHVALRHEAPAIELDQGTVGQTRLRIRSGGRLLLDVKREAPAGFRSLPLNPATLRNLRPAPRRAHERLVLAFYYGWWGSRTGPSKAWRHWRPWRPRMSVPHVPTLGYYDSRDPKVIGRHIELAKKAGIDGFVLSWWAESGHDPQVLGLLLAEAKKRDFRITVYVEQARKRERLRQRLKFIIDGFGDHPAFLQADGRPVIFFYDPVHQVVDRRDMRHALQGLKGYWVAGQSDGRHLARLDAMHVYYIARDPMGYMRNLRTTSAVAMLRDTPVIATVTPGYDDRLERSPGFHRPREGGRTFDRLWRGAWQADWVLLVSWNEWHEGSQLEPSEEYGERYLELTRRHRARWLGEVIGLPLAVTLAQPDNPCTPVLDAAECPPPWTLPAGVPNPKLVRTIGKMLKKVRDRATAGGQKPFDVHQIRALQRLPTPWLSAKGKLVRKTQSAMVVIRQAAKRRCLALPMILEKPAGKGRSRLRVGGFGRAVPCS